VVVVVVVVGVVAVVVAVVGGVGGGGGGGGGGVGILKKLGVFTVRTLRSYGGAAFPAHVSVVRGCIPTCFPRERSCDGPRDRLFTKNPYNVQLSYTKTNYRTTYITM